MVLVFLCLRRDAIKRADCFVKMNGKGQMVCVNTSILMIRIIGIAYIVGKLFQHIKNLMEREAKKGIAGLGKGNKKRFN